MGGGGRRDRPERKTEGVKEDDEGIQFILPCAKYIKLIKTLDEHYFLYHPRVPRRSTTVSAALATPGHNPLLHISPRPTN